MKTHQIQKKIFHTHTLVWLTLRETLHVTYSNRPVNGAAGATKRPEISDQSNGSTQSLFVWVSSPIFCRL